MNVLCRPKGSLRIIGLHQPLGRRPVKERDRDQDLRQNQEIGSPLDVKIERLIIGANAICGRALPERGSARSIWLFVDFFEFAKLLVAARHRAVQGLLGRFGVVPDQLQLFVDDVADLNEISQPQTAGNLVGSRRVICLMPTSW